MEWQAITMLVFLLGLLLMAAIMIQFLPKEWWKQEGLEAWELQAWHLLQCLDLTPHREHQAMLLSPKVLVFFFQQRSFS